MMFEVGLDGLVTCKGGQMVITSMDARYEEIKGQGERDAVVLTVFFFFCL